MVYSQGTITTSNVVTATDRIKLLMLIFRMLVLVFFIGLMHLESREDLVEIATLVDNVVIK